MKTHTPNKNKKVNLYGKIDGKMYAAIIELHDGEWKVKADYQDGDWCEGFFAKFNDFNGALNCALKYVCEGKSPPSHKAIAGGAQ